MQRLQPADFAQWRALARPLLGEGVPPEHLAWSDPRVPGLFGDEASAPASPQQRAAEPAADDPLPRTRAAIATPRVPQPLMQLLELVALHRDARRWELMYRLVWRTVHRQPRLIEDAADPQLREAQQMAGSVRRDLHKMHAFVRFRTVQAEDGERYLSWFEPEHLILARGAQFFVRRFASLHWMICTPDGSALWDRHCLTLHDAPRRDQVPRADALDAMWRTYYRSICNAARINPEAMQREMPRRYWKLLPEASEITQLLRDSAPRVARFGQHPTVDRRDRHEPIRTAGPAIATHDGAQASLEACRRCPLWERATQAVPGVGPAPAALMLVGEQPGDEEDLAGRPFVGPAGRLLDALLREAGIARDQVYLTNAVKHFKWEPRGKRRIHKTAAQHEVAACQHWLLQELAAVKPRVVVALGATALRALTAQSMPVERARTQPLRAADGSLLRATYHPSAILRASGAEAVRLREALVQDLRRAAAGAPASHWPGTVTR